MLPERLEQNILDIANPEPCSASDEDPLKNAFCPHYDQCLDLAFTENWPQFTCQACGFQNFHIEIEPNAGEKMGYYRLLSRVFFNR